MERLCGGSSGRRTGGFGGKRRGTEREVLANGRSSVELARRWGDYRLILRGPFF